MISIVSNSYYGMLRGQININVPPEYPIMCFGTIEIKMAAVSAKRSMSADSTGSSLSLCKTPAYNSHKTLFNDHEVNLFRGGANINTI